MFDATVEDVFRQELQRLHYHELRFARQLANWKSQIHGDHLLEALKDAQEHSAIALGRLDVLLAYLKLGKTGLGCPLLAALEENCRVRLQLLRREELGEIVILCSWLQWKHLGISAYVASVELANVLGRFDVATSLRQGMEENLEHIRTVSDLLVEVSSGFRPIAHREITMDALSQVPLYMRSRTPESGNDSRALSRAVENLLGPI